MDDGIKERLHALLRHNTKAINKPDGSAIGAEILGIGLVQIADTLNDVKRIADALEKLSNFELTAERIGEIAKVFMGEPKANNDDAELFEINSRENFLNVQTDNGPARVPAEYIRHDQSLILIPKSNAHFWFEKHGDVWHANKLEIDNA